MKILFVASDPGGSRALIPIIDACEERDLHPVVVDHGYLGKEVNDVVMKINAQEFINYEHFKNSQSRHAYSVLCFGTSLTDKIPLRIVSNAKKIDIPTICILDNWMNYKHRLCLYKDCYIWPDVYAVMDEYAKIKAIEEGIPEETIKVTGHPAFSNILDIHQEVQRIDSSNNIHVKNKKHIVFVSEPVEHDNLNAASEKLKRNYTEKDVLKILYDKCKLLSEKLSISILPHPREDINSLKSYISEIGGTADDVVIDSHNRKIIDSADGVIGMTSILLYESWLKGKPTLSLQPGLVRDDLNIFEDREGVFCINNFNTQQNIFDEWINKVLYLENITPRKDALIHNLSIDSIFNNMSKLAYKK